MKGGRKNSCKLTGVYLLGSLDGTGVQVIQLYSQIPIDPVRADGIFAYPIYPELDVVDGFVDEDLLLQLQCKIVIIL